MVFLLLIFRTFLWTPYLLLIGGWYRWGGGGGEELKWRQLAHHRLMSQKGPILVHTVELKPKIKGQISGRMVYNGIIHVAFASVYSEKNRMKKCWIMIIIIIKVTQKQYGKRICRDG